MNYILYFGLERWYFQVEQSLEKLHFNVSIWYNIRQNFSEKISFPPFQHEQVKYILAWALLQGWQNSA